MSRRRLPDDFAWEQTFYAGEYHNQWWLKHKGSPVALVTTTIHGQWYSMVNRHYDIGSMKPQKIARAPSREAAQRHVEIWAHAHQARLRREVIPPRGHTLKR